MTDPELLKRITVRPEVFGGKPIIRNMRISVELILSLLAQGVAAEPRRQTVTGTPIDEKSHGVATTTASSVSRAITAWA